MYPNAETTVEAGIAISSPSAFLYETAFSLILLTVAFVTILICCGIMLVTTISVKMAGFISKIVTSWFVCAMNSAVSPLLEKRIMIEGLLRALIQSIGAPSYAKISNEASLFKK